MHMYCFLYTVLFFWHTPKLPHSLTPPQTPCIKDKKQKWKACSFFTFAETVSAACSHNTHTHTRLSLPLASHVSIVIDFSGSIRVPVGCQFSSSLKACASLVSQTTALRL